MLVCRHQAFVPMTIASVWDLVGRPERHPEWWPEVIEVQGSRFGRGCSYCQVADGDEGRTETMLLVEKVEELRELLVRCSENGLFMRWLLTEAQGGTFVDAEFGIDPERASVPDPDFDPDASKETLRRWLQSSLDGLAASASIEN